MNKLDIKQLLPELKKQVTLLAEDLLKRVNADAPVNNGLKEAFKQIEKGGRTAQAYEVWLEDYLDQVAVAWVLACVFVRFMEDNGLIDECWPAGEGEHRKLADDAHTLYFREHPHESDREYFQHVFKECGKIPAAKDLFAEGKTPLWAVGPSADAAMQLLKFWREMDVESGHLKRSFEVEPGDTRFLGDLYQELSERAKDKYALLQTPVFVEEFILDRTLTPAIAEFGLEQVRMIDPTCGSGHFLLGGFARLFNLWSQRESNEIKVAQKALDGVWGVDINPFAVEIAQFRLIVAAVRACGIKRLKQAPGWNIHLATGDSLLFGSKPSFGGERVEIAQQRTLFEVPALYAVEDRKTLQQILGQGYQVVVGNPPYITVKDKAQNEAYRQLYSTCHRKYSLGVPFTQRFWELAIQSGEDNGGCGYIGMITANSFMKREFGKKLIEEFFPKIDLTHVLDTSGAYIPGHGTPTVILFGRNRPPVGESVRAVLGIKGEPDIPEDAACGLVWRSIITQIDVAGSQDAYTSAADVPRTTFNDHPWSIGGGGAADLQECLNSSFASTLSDVTTVIGVFGMTNCDEVFMSDRESFIRNRVEPTLIRQLLMGDEVRDWLAESTTFALFPYNDDETLLDVKAYHGLHKWMWRCRTVLGNRATFGKGTYFSEDLPWWKWHQVAVSRLQTPFTIVLPNIATHNHFVIDRNKRLCNVTALIIKLPEEATEDSHVELIGLLNSSVCCFWIKQRFQTKGSSGMGRGIYDERWEFFFQISGTGLGAFPLPEQKPLSIAKEMDALGQENMSCLPNSTVRLNVPNGNLIEQNRHRASNIRGKLIALQEELDWYCYQLYDLLSDDLRYTGGELPKLGHGQRAFEIIMARQMAKGEMKTSWFERHGSTPITEIPSHWPVDYRKVVERRIQVIETNKEIALIEKPEYKRRWNDESWQAQEQRALKNWLLDRLETPKYRKGTKDNRNRPPPPGPPGIHGDRLWLDKRRWARRHCRRSA